MLSVAYWRFFVNALLVFCDMASFILAAVVVLMTQSEINLYSSRFHFHINLWAYVVVCALVWVFCLHSVGVYHRHVMGDGYQLNVLLFKGAVFAGLMICAFEFILNIYVSLLSTVLELLCALLVTMVVRLAVRQFVLFKRKRGTYSYGTVVVGSLEGIEHALQFLSQKSQLNYHAIAVCPIGLNPQTGYVEAVDAPAEFRQRIREICGQGHRHAVVLQELRRACRVHGRADGDGNGCDAPVLGQFQHVCAERGDHELGSGVDYLRGGCERP